MFQIKPYAEKPSTFGLSVHGFVSYERIGKCDEDRYKKGGRKPYFIELDDTPEIDKSLCGNGCRCLL